jgi:hypothetical protein
VTKFTIVAEVTAFGIFQTDITAHICATSFLANVVTNKIAKGKPFGTVCIDVPMIPS